MNHGKIQKDILTKEYIKEDLLRAEKIHRNIHEEIHFYYSSVKGNEFYVVIFEGEIVYAYNMKFFEYRE